MEKTELALLAVKELKSLYPDGPCSLEYAEEPYKLLVMAVLSAQCTDARVNAVSAPLFEKYKTARDMAAAPDGELEELIRPVGLYNSKAKNLRAACAMLTEKYGGSVPREMADLLSLPGVGRKVANLLRGDLYGLGGIVADTHCTRISHRLGLASKRNPLVAERELSKLVPLEEQSGLCHRFVLFGREYCKARSPRCAACPLSAFCPKKGIRPS